MKLTLEMEKKIVEATAADYSSREIAKALNISQGSVMGVLKKRNVSRPKQAKPKLIL